MSRGRNIYLGRNRNETVAAATTPNPANRGGQMGRNPRNPTVEDPATESKVTGPLSVLEINDYDISKLQYPIDRFDQDIPSYITFYINLPTVAKYESLITDDPEARSVSDQNLDRSRGNNIALSNITESIASGFVVRQVQELAEAATRGDFGGAAGEGILRVGGKKILEFGAKTVGAGAVGSFSNTIEKKPRYNRIKGSISLYMPDTVFHTNSHDYDVQSLTDAMGFLGMGERFKPMLPDSWNPLEIFKNVGGNPGAEAVGRILEGTGLAGSGFTDFQLRSQGAAINPQLEVVFKATPNRQFIYNFKFQPRSKREAEQVRKIIRQFKFYAAPELADGTGLYYTPPAQFDIQYMFQGKENKFIGKISSCVLENIDVDYSPAGQFATFDDGTPVQINMQLRFREVDTITREMVAAGF